MFESNFPVDKALCSYAVLWNAFKRIVQNFSRDERPRSLSRYRAHTYRLPLHGRGVGGCRVEFSSSGNGGIRPLTVPGQLKF